MNTSDFNTHGLPDEKALEKLANEFFNALPGEVVNHDFASSHLQQPQSVNDVMQHQPVVQDFDPSFFTLPDPNFAGAGKVPMSMAGSGVSLSTAQHPQSFDIKQPPSSLPDPNFAGVGKIPMSVAGSGVSPSAVQHPQSFDIKQPPTSLPDPNFAGVGNIPMSVAGSGVSPSAVQQPQSFDIKQPPSSLPDPNFAGVGNIPMSVAGSGVSPSAVQHPQSFDIKQPPSSLPDPNFAGAGQVPQSVSGSGLSPSGSPQAASGFADGYSPTLEQATVPHHASPIQPVNVPGVPAQVQQLPFHDHSYEAQLRDVLNAITTFTEHPQLPSEVELPDANSSPYYFINDDEWKKHTHQLPGITSTDFSPEHEPAGHVRPPFHLNIIKNDFPIFKERVNGKPLIWLDNAATTQKPRQVIERISYFYEHENSNIHRAAHELAARATDAYEEARKKVQVFLNAASPNEIVFVRGTTEGINLVAKSWGEQFLQPGDEIIISHLEHHANIVPWQQLAAKNKLKLRVIPVDDDGQIILGEYAKLLNAKTKLVSISQVSNALGTITPTKQVVDMAHHAGAKVLVDGAQSIAHARTDVRALDADWFVFSGHKIFGPTGIGAVYGKEALLNETQPWQGGGNMIQDVTFEHTKYHNAPARFEAGTGNIADAVGLGAALDYVQRLGMQNIEQYEHYLLLYATHLMKQVPGLRMIGTAPDKASVLSFILDGYSTAEVGAALNSEGIAVRSGHHCAQPILRRFGVETTVRPSLAFYNSCADVDAMLSVLWRLKGRK